VDAALLIAMGERNRMRIVELLNAAPRSVGEIAGRLELRQPQVSKHLRMLERAGLVKMHPLGQRRIYALRRERFAELRHWVDALAAAPSSSEIALEQYGSAIRAETMAARGGRDFGRGRVFSFERELGAPPRQVWAYWTTGRLVRRWWSPEHFEVVRARLQPVAGGRIEIVMQEGDGTRHASRGHFAELQPPKRLLFELAPIGPDGAPLLAAVHALRLAGRRDRTRLSLRIRVTNASPAAVPALAGMELGWKQLLDKLAKELGGPNRRPLTAARD
jgi:uncharacterized protein YndB with AHSA1/START domain/DNA-binding MarR family transcriptional regulator